MKYLLLFTAIVIAACNQPSKAPDNTKISQPQEKGKVRHSKDKAEFDIPGKVKKEYPLTQFYPFSKDIILTDGADKNKKVDAELPDVFQYSDDSTHIVVWKSKKTGKKGGHYFHQKHGKFDIEDDEVVSQSEDMFTCSTSDTALGGVMERQMPSNELVTPKIIKVMYEARYSVYQAMGSNVQATVDYVAGCFAGVSSLLSQAQINRELSQLIYWSSPDPYTGASSYNILISWRNYRYVNSWTGNIAGLLGCDPGGLGGIASSVAVVCSNNYRYFYADINSSFSPVPTYSWTIEVLAHEELHIIALPHSHSCFYPDYFPGLNGKTIDGCAPSVGYPVEGNTCTAGAVPSTGGEVISYCHLTGVGIDFTNPFSVWTDSIVQLRMNGYTCLDQSGYTCNDTHENNDTTANAFLLQNKIWIKGCFGTQQDQDFYRATTTADRTKLSISIDSVTVTTYVQIFKRINATTNTLVKSQNIPANSGVTVITHTEATKAVYYIKIEPLAPITTQTWDYKIMKKNLIQ